MNIILYNITKITSHQSFLYHSNIQVNNTHLIIKVFFNYYIENITVIDK